MEGCTVDSLEPTRKGNLRELELVGDLDEEGAVVHETSPMDAKKVVT